MATKKPRHGKERPSGPGRKSWRVAAYYPSASKPFGLVRYKDPEKAHLPPEKQWTSRVPEDGVTVDELFDRVERNLDRNVAVGHTTAAGQQRTMRALRARYIEWLESQGRAEATLRKYEDLLDTWVMPTYGDKLVADWSAEWSAAIIRAAREKGLSAQRVEDLGVALSGLRKTAWRKSNGVRWLSREDDPLEDVSYSRRGTEHGAHRDYVPPSQRPTQRMVAAAVVAARVVGKRVESLTLSLQVAVACLVGLRLGEQLGLRAVDVDLRARKLDVNGAWVWPRRRKGQTEKPTPFRAPVKTRMRRTAPYPGSLHAELVVAAAAALGLPDGAPEADVVAAIDAERSRRARLHPKGDWRNVKVHDDDRDECWLFADPSTSLPWTKERFNALWHEMVAETAEWEAQDDCAYREWPRSIVYRNARHHCATWWHDVLGFSWRLVATYLGNEVATLHAHYLRTGEDEEEASRTALDRV
jgi:hypothetical protein